MKEFHTQTISFSNFFGIFLIYIQNNWNYLQEKNVAVNVNNSKLILLCFVFFFQKTIISGILLWLTQVT